MRTLLSGEEVKYLPLCGRWGNHLRANHVKESEANVAVNGLDGQVGDGDNNGVADFAAVLDKVTQDGGFQGILARLRHSGLF